MAVTRINRHIVKLNRNSLRQFLKSREKGVIKKEDKKDEQI